MRDNMKFNKFIMEICNQEYAGNLNGLMEAIK